MRKSIYYLIANAVSTIAAIIFIACINQQFPFFGNDLRVDRLSADGWEPMKYVLPVLVLSIIVMTQDVISFHDHGKDPKKVPFGTGKDIIMGIITVISILFTWFAVILEFDGYKGNELVSLPIYFIIFYLVGVALILVSPVISKKNQGIGAALVFASLLLMVSGLLYELLPYWYTLVAALSVTVLAFAVPSVLSLRSKN